MISIIIPTYNYVCLKLVSDLALQAARLKETSTDGFDYEIIVADDGSNNQTTVKQNQPINEIPQCRYVVRTTNTGRAYVCNWLLEQARFDHVLLIDSDAAVCTPDFIATYWNNRHAADALCGSIRNPDIPCPSGCELRYRYEHQAERARAKRDINENPYFRLSTFNVMFNKKRLGKLKFDLRCKEYGYEDALLGLTLQEQGHTIRHLDNPLIHTGIDSNTSFLKKTEAAMRTLKGLDGIMQNHAGTSRMYNKLKRLHLLPLFRVCFSLVRPLLLRNLQGHHPILLFFQLYKLGYYTEINR